MAGDWIKMRGSLSTHPKVLTIASIIGEDAAIGKALTTGFSGSLDEIVTSRVITDIVTGALLRVWSAANEHTEDGVFRDCGESQIDIIAGFKGFADAMILVGWLVIDEENNSAILPNFLEYNAPAKNGARSSAAERQRRYREKLKASRYDNANVTRDITSDDRERVDKSNKPEKSIQQSDVSLKTKKPTTSTTEKGGNRNKPWPEDFCLTAELEQYGREKLGESADVAAVWEQFQNFHQAKRSLFADWSAAWRTWVGKALEFNRIPTMDQHRSGVTQAKRIFISQLPTLIDAIPDHEAGEPCDFLARPKVEVAASELFAAGNAKNHLENDSLSTIEDLEPF